MIEEKTFAEAKQAIFDFDTEKAVNIVREVVSSQENPLELMDNAFIPALNEINTCGNLPAEYWAVVFCSNNN